jgi:MYXO-CTERM domain-containing protein
VHNTPAVDGNIVVFGASNGVVHAVDAATGAELWKDDLGAGLATNVSWLYAAPSIVDGIVYVGTQKHFAALDEKTGRELWSVDPSPNAGWLGSFAAAGVSDGVVIGNFSRGADGIVAWRAEDGHELWRIPQPLSTAINGSVVIDGMLAFFGNSETDVYGVDLMSAQVRWQKKLFSTGFDFGYGIAATPALGHGKLIVPTQYGVVIALDEQSGAEAWRQQTGATVLRPVHYYGAGTKPYASSPVVTDDLVWIAGADGMLRALDLETGTGVWSTNLGSPILAGPIPAGDSLFIATFDGTVQALRHVDQEPALDTVNVCQGKLGGGGCSVGGGGGGGALLLVLAVLAWRRKRK